MDTGQVVLLATTISGVVSGIVGGIIAIMNNWHKNTQVARKAKFDEQEKIIDRQEAQIARKESEIREKDQVIEKIVAEVHDYREEVAELRLYISLLREDFLADGRKPRDMPAPRKRSVDPDFLAKTTQTNTKLDEAIDAKLRAGQQGGAATN